MSEPAEFIDITDVYNDLCGIIEIAAGLDVKPSRVRRWIERRDATNCPMPIRALGVGNVYSLREWKGWFALWRVTRGSETWLTKVPKPDAKFFS